MKKPTKSARKAPPKSARSKARPGAGRAAARKPAGKLGHKRPAAKKVAGKRTAPPKKKSSPAVKHPAKPHAKQSGAHTSVHKALLEARDAKQRGTKAISSP